MIMLCDAHVTGRLCILQMFCNAARATCILASN